MYGWRNRYSSGIWGGRIDRRVTNTGRVWYGRNVVRRNDVLNSCILDGP